MDLDSNSLVLNSTSSSLEKYLFHGVQRSYVDIICRNNFDWRTCGVSHGIMYGQGTYFARDASYAHRYTDHQPKTTTHLAVVDTNSDVVDINLTPSSPTSINNVQQSMIEHNTYSSVSALDEPMQDSISDKMDRKLERDAIPPITNDTFLKEDLKDSNQALNFINQIPESMGNKEFDWKQHVRNMFLARVQVGSYTEGRRLYRKPPPIDPTNPFGRTYHSCVNYVNDPSLFVVFDSAQYFPEYLIHYTNRPLLS